MNTHVRLVHTTDTTTIVAVDDPTHGGLGGRGGSPGGRHAAQAGPFRSPGNEVTAGFVSAAMASEDTRTRRRVIAGTEGTSKA